MVQVLENKHTSAVKLEAMTGMPRYIFDDFWVALRWSHQPKDRPTGLSHAAYHRKFINGIEINIKRILLYSLSEFVSTSSYCNGIDLVANRSMLA